MSIDLHQDAYPGDVLSLGDNSMHVLNTKLALNTIATNYPAIPMILPINSIFDENMEAAVKEFQNIFDLPVTGVIDKATWYQIEIIHASVVRLAGLSAIGIIIDEAGKDMTDIEDAPVIPRVQLLQYFLNVLSAYYSSISPVDIDGVLGPITRASIMDFQQTFGLPVTGLVDEETWDTIYNSVLGIISQLPPTAVALPSLIYPEIIHMEGSEGPEVLIIQELLSYIRTRVPELPPMETDGIFGPKTANAIRVFQRVYGLWPDGIVDEETWNRLVEVYRELRFGIIENGYPNGLAYYSNYHKKGGPYYEYY